MPSADYLKELSDNQASAIEQLKSGDKDGAIEAFIDVRAELDQLKEEAEDE